MQLDWASLTAYCADGCFQGNRHDCAPLRRNTGCSGTLSAQEYRKTRYLPRLFATSGPCLGIRTGSRNRQHRAGVFAHDCQQELRRERYVLPPGYFHRLACRFHRRRADRLRSLGALPGGFLRQQGATMAHPLDHNADPTGRRGSADQAAQRNGAGRRPGPTRVAQFAALTFLISAGFLLVGYALS